VLNRSDGARFVRIRRSDEIIIEVFPRIPDGHEFDFEVFSSFGLREDRCRLVIGEFLGLLILERPGGLDHPVPVHPDRLLSNPVKGLGELQVSLPGDLFCLLAQLGNWSCRGIGRELHLRHVIFLQTR